MAPQIVLRTRTVFRVRWRQTAVGAQNSSNAQRRYVIIKFSTAPVTNVQKQVREARRLRRLVEAEPKGEEKRSRRENGVKGREEGTRREKRRECFSSSLFISGSNVRSGFSRKDCELQRVQWKLFAMHCPSRLRILLLR